MVTWVRLSKKREQRIKLTFYCSIYSFIGLNKQKISAYNCKYFLPIILAYALGAQKNRLIETVLLSTHNICFG